MSQRDALIAAKQHIEEDPIEEDPIDYHLGQPER